MLFEFRNVGYTDQMRKWFDLNNGFDYSLGLLTFIQQISTCQHTGLIKSIVKFPNYYEKNNLCGRYYADKVNTTFWQNLKNSVDI